MNNTKICVLRHRGGAAAANAEVEHEVCAFVCVCNAEVEQEVSVLFDGCVSVHVGVYKCVCVCVFVCV